MALSSVDFRFKQPAWDRLRYSRTGMVAKDIDRRIAYIERMAKVQVGVDTSALRRSIVRSMHTAPGTGPLGVVSAGGPSAPHALMHHEGTRPHPITPRAGRSVLKFKMGGRTVYATRVMHPGTRENNYLTDHLETAVRI